MTHAIEILILVLSAANLGVSVANVLLDHQQHRAPRPPHGPIR